MKQLILETSTTMSSWALFDNKKLQAEGSFEGRVSINLAQELAQVCKSVERVDEIIVGIGPGSFSGIRVGIATAQGLALGWKAQVKPIMSTHSFAQDFLKEEKLGIFIPSRQKEWFVCQYGEGKYEMIYLIPDEQLQSEKNNFTCCLTTELIDGITQSIPRASQLGYYSLTRGVSSERELEPIHPDQLASE
jgi:tRNA threonylcarbamoyl adenosine modification protein YeaZ